MWKLYVGCVFLCLASSLDSASAACPDACSCFGHNGELVADCARRRLESVPEFDPATTEIHLQYNNIETLQAGDFANVPKLKHLYLHSNKITKIPDGLFDNLPELESLRINHNRIADLGENKFANLKKVVLLYAHKNRLTTLARDAFNGMDSVKQISVAGNSDLSDIDIAAFRHDLTMIDISGSAVTTLDSRMFNLNPGLEKLYLYGIDTLICDSDLQSFIAYMNRNPLTVFGRSTMKCAQPDNLRGKSLINLRGDNFAEPGSCPVECVCFDGIADCSSRSLSALPSGFAPETTEIFLQNNNISRLGNNAFLHLNKLEVLHLHDNRINSWDVNSFGGVSTTLKQLTLQNNELSGIPVGVFTSMRSLEILNLNDNLISVIRPSTFSDMFSLVQLTLQNNEIQILPDTAFSSLSSLKYLGLANNRLSNVSASLLAHSPELYYLDISGNELDALPKVPPGLTRMVARDCRIKSLTKSSLDGATNLQVLDVSHNTIYVFEEDAFSGATSLVQLDMSHNTMEAIDDAAFSSATRLEWFDLSNNARLTTISDNAFGGQVHTMYRLYLDDCGLSYLNPKVISIMHRSDFYVTFSGNPWNCDCKLQELSLFVEANPSKTGDATCVEPKEEAGKAIEEVEYCVVEAPSDDSLALVMSLTMVLSILLIVAVTGMVVWKSKKAPKNVVTNMEAPSVHATSEQGNGVYNNKAYDNTDPDKTEL